MDATKSPLPEIGTNVRIICEDENKHEGWFAVPMTMTKAPEGFKLIDGYGDVTGYDYEHQRSVNGRQPIVVMKHMYVGFDPNHWR